MKIRKRTIGINTGNAVLASGKEITHDAFQRWTRNYRTAARLDGYHATARTLSLEHDGDATICQAKRAVRENIRLVLLAMSFALLNQTFLHF